MPSKWCDAPEKLALFIILISQEKIAFVSIADTPIYSRLVAGCPARVPAMQWDLL